MTFTWKHQLYRLRDSHGRLLYVGITHSINRRFTDHVQDQPWWSEVATCDVQFYASREALAKAEQRAIFVERPRYNKVHNKPNRIQYGPPVGPDAPPAPKKKPRAGSGRPPAGGLIDRGTVWTAEWLDPNVKPDPLAIWCPAGDPWPEGRWITF